MHELGIVFNIADSLEEVARENNLKSIRSVTVEIGEVSTVIPEYLTDCWAWTKKKREIIRDCEMKVDIIHAITHCDGCGRDYGTVAHGRICPYCKSEKTYLVTGNEISIKEITVPDED